MAPLVDLRTETPLIGPAEHKASLILGAVALALVCWLLLASSYLLGPSAWAANFAALVFLFGAGLFHYGTYDSCFTHIYSALGFSLLVWLWLRSPKGRPGPLWAFALICFLLTAMRTTNLIPILFLLPVCGKPRWWVREPAAWRVGLAVGAGVALAVVLQFAYNYYATRQIAFSTYEPGSFLFNRPMQWQVLFSYERGLFIYYPVLAVALAAGLWSRRTRIATCWFTGLIAALAIMYGFWVSWHLCGGMGHRGFVEVMPFAVLLLAVALPDLAPGKRRALMAIGAVLAFVTLEIMCGYWAATFPFEGATAGVYWQHVVGRYSLLPFLGRM